MDLFSAFSPKTLIHGIPQARTTGRILDGSELSVLKDKLLAAEDSKDIIRAARGEGRKEILNTIVTHDSVLFNWGVKSQHAFHQASKYRDFLEPSNTDIALMKRIISLYHNALKYRFSHHFSDSQKHLYTNKDVVKQLNQIIDKNRYSHEKLLLIKDWLCYVLHTSGDTNFKNISPWISASIGDLRYKTAYCFGQGSTKFVKANAERAFNSRFVIFDTWVPVGDEHIAFEKTSYLIETLAALGLPWYNDEHHEIMLKYAIYPHRLIGYYYIENDDLLYFYVNPHYLARWSEDPSFQIGDDLDINQEDVQFPAENPYRMIYSRSGNKFSVHDRR